MNAPHPYHDPPKLLLRFLRWFCSEAYLEEVEGDLYEYFQEEVEARGLNRARRRFWFTAIRYIRPFFFDSRHVHLHSYYRQAMFTHYVKTSWRHLTKQRFYSTINIGGLALGMACCIAVLFFVNDETSYDTYHQKQDNLYRLSIQDRILSSGEEEGSATTPILWGPALKKDYPEVTDYARFVRLADASDPWKLSYGDNEFFESELLYADPATFELFSWNLLQGNPQTALNEQRSIILTERMSKKYFGDEDPMGKIITLDPRLRNEGALTGETFEYAVTGVVQDLPRRSHFTFDFLLPSVGLNGVFGGDINTGSELNNWFWRGRLAHTYLYLKPGTDPATLEAKFEAFQERYVGDATRSRGYVYEPYLQRIDNIYLEGNMGGQLQPVGDMNNIYLFSLVAVFLLLIACINFMNLSTARSAIRAKEVGLRKVIGAMRKQLITQFLGESILISLLAFLLAILLARGALEILYGYLNKELVIDYQREWAFFLSLTLLVLIVGILAGSYPAFYLSRFKPVEVLKGWLPSGNKGGYLRKGLVVFQFIISAFLIIATLTVFKQLNFMRNHDLGFDQERVVVIPPGTARPLATHYEALKKELEEQPSIASVTMTSAIPGQGGGGDLYVAKGAAPESAFGLGEAFVDYNFVDMFDLNLVAGRNFSRELSTDEPRRENGRITELAVILNQEAVQKFGWNSAEEALGKQIIRDPNAGDWTATVIGVMEDFHFQTLQQPITPAGLFLLNNYQYLAVKLQPGEISASLAAIEDQVQAFAPESDFDYNFLDETFRAQYEEEQRLAEVFGYISSLAIFIACMGLLGLAAFTTSQRRKEIGIRKTLGASVSHIVLLLSKNFTLLVLIAIGLAIPIAYFVTEWWLEFFAYRIQGNVGVFILAGILAMMIAWLTVGIQTFRAAHSQPAKSLRYE